MSQENVEIVRRLFAAVDRRDAATVLTLYDPEVEWDTSRSPFGDLMGGRVYYGHEGLRTWSRQWYEAWEDVEHHCDELIEVGEHVVSAVTNRGRGRTSGIEVETHQAAVWTVREGKIVRAVWFPTRSEALEAAGRNEVTDTSANLDLVRSLYAAWERGDWSSVEWAHPEIEFVIAGGPEPGSWNGVAGMVEGFRGILSAWEDWSTEAEEYRELDGERVLVLTHYSGRGKASGLDVGQMRTANGATLFHIRGDKVTRLVLYWNRKHALADLG